MTSILKGATEFPSNYCVISLYVFLVAYYEHFDLIYSHICHCSANFLVILIGMHTVVNFA